MKRKHFVSRLTIVALLGSVPMVTGACGFIFSHAPPQGHEQMEYFTCTESNTGPIIDFIAAGGYVLSALIVAGDQNNYMNPGAYIAYTLAWGAFTGAAAPVGFAKSRKCRAAKRQLAVRQAAQRQGEPRDLRAADVVVQTVVVSPAADTLAIGERVQLGATAYSSSGGIISNQTFTWSSSNDAVASVSNAGLVTAHANGSVVIAANTDNVVGTANIVVASPR